jgi:hypothetical protein
VCGRGHLLRQRLEPARLRCEAVACGLARVEREDGADAGHHEHRDSHKRSQQLTRDASRCPM